MNYLEGKLFKILKMDKKINHNKMNILWISEYNNDKF